MARTITIGGAVREIEVTVSRRSKSYTITVVNGEIKGTPRRTEHLTDTDICIAHPKSETRSYMYVNHLGVGMSTQDILPSIGTRLHNRVYKWEDGKILTGHGAAIACAECPKEWASNGAYTAFIGTNIYVHDKTVYHLPEPIELAIMPCEGKELKSFFAVTRTEAYYVNGQLYAPIGRDIIRRVWIGADGRTYVTHSGVTRRFGLRVEIEEEAFLRAEQ